jgi:rhodanese-related sulfurtransferase
VAPLTIADLLDAARSSLTRLTPEQTLAAMGPGAELIDIRSERQRARDGVIPGARFIARNVFEWRCDPASPWRDLEIARPDNRLIVICDQGYQSSLAAATLVLFGFENPGDVIGGFQAWRAAGLPVQSAQAAHGSAAAGPDDRGNGPTTLED